MSKKKALEHWNEVTCDREDEPEILDTLLEYRDPLLSRKSQIFCVSYTQINY